MLISGTYVGFDIMDGCPLPIHIFVQEITTALELSDPKIREWVPPGYSCLACFRVGNPVDSDGQQTAAALEGARNLDRTQRSCQV